MTASIVPLKMRFRFLGKLEWIDFSFRLFGWYKEGKGVSIAWISFMASDDTKFSPAFGRLILGDLGVVWFRIRGDDVDI